MKIKDYLLLYGVSQYQLNGLVHFQSLLYIWKPLLMFPEASLLSKDRGEKGKIVLICINCVICSRLKIYKQHEKINEAIILFAFNCKDPPSVF